MGWRGRREKERVRVATVGERCDSVIERDDAAGGDRANKSGRVDARETATKLLGVLAQHRVVFVPSTEGFLQDD